MKKNNFGKQYLACAVLAAVCAGFIYTPQVAEAKFGVITGYSDYDNKDVAKFLGKDWYVVGGTVTTGTPTTLTLLSKDCWNGVKTIFNPSTGDIYNNYGSSPYQVSDGQNNSGSTLKNCLEGIYTGLKADIRFEVDANYTKAVKAINEVNLDNIRTGDDLTKDYSFGSAHFYAPSKDEIKSDGGTFGLEDDQRSAGTVDYWLRSTANETSNAWAGYYNYAGGDVGGNDAASEKYIRPVIQVDVAKAGTTLQNAVESKNHTSCFSVSTDALTGIASSTFAGNGSATSTQAYASVADDAPNLDCTYLVLDGASIKIKSDIYTGINNGTVDTPVYCTTIGAVLVNENDLTSPLASGSTFTNIDGKIDYIATLSENSGILNGNLNGVAIGTYGLKIFGIDNTNYKATQLGTGVINKLEKTNDGKLNITIGSVNGGFALTLSNGAGVTLDGNANNAITVSSGISKLNMAGKTLSGAVGVYQEAELDVSGGGTFSGNGNQITGMMKVVDENKVTFTKTIDIYATGTLEVINAEFDLNVVNEGSLIVKGDVVFGADANLKEDGNLTIKSGNVKFWGTDIENKVKALEAKVAELEAKVKELTEENEKLKSQVAGSA